MTGRNLAAGLTAAAFAVGLLAVGSVLAHGDDMESRDPGYGMGYNMEPDAIDEYCPGCGMMGGYGMGPRMMGGYAMGPGMMGGYGMDPGMMGGYGMGPGMMSGYGMGPGMMGGYGMGPGTMGAGPMEGLELSRDQRERMARIETELRKRNWSLQGGIIDAQGELLELYADETPDPRKIGAVYGKIFDLRRQMIEATIEAQNHQRAILTDEQRKMLRTGSYGGMHHQHHHRMTAE